MLFYQSQTNFSSSDNSLLFSSRLNHPDRYGSLINDVCSTAQSFYTIDLRILHAVTYDGEDAEMASVDDETKEYPCLVRVTNGKEVKFSTRVRLPF